MKEDMPLTPVDLTKMILAEVLGDASDEEDMSILCAALDIETHAIMADMTAENKYSHAVGIAAGRIMRWMRDAEDYTVPETYEHFARFASL